jgi:hypothetical protein
MNKLALCLFAYLFVNTAGANEYLTTKPALLKNKILVQQKDNSLHIPSVKIFSPKGKLVNYLTWSDLGEQSKLLEKKALSEFSDINTDFSEEISDLNQFKFNKEKFQVLIYSIPDTMCPPCKKKKSELLENLKALQRSHEVHFINMVPKLL